MYVQVAWSSREDDLLAQMQTLQEQVTVQDGVNQQAQQELEHLRDQVKLNPVPTVSDQKSLHKLQCLRQFYCCGTCQPGIMQSCAMIV